MVLDGGSDEEKQNWPDSKATWCLRSLRERNAGSWGQRHTARPSACTSATEAADSEQRAREESTEEPEKEWPERFPDSRRAKVPSHAQLNSTVS